MTPVIIQRKPLPPPIQETKPQVAGASTMIEESSVALALNRSKN
jgi:hypothetical protein